ncbi:MAG TPA: type II secretion system protein GspJ [Candidatus Nitrosopolaris sp.]|nr:type II secretion system protein GspJ [Candidatus Nitrosopolaris sp.]
MSKRGITLLETLVALGLTALVLAALEGTVLRAAGARGRASAVAEREAAERSVLLRLNAELEAAPVADDPRQRFAVEPAAGPAQPWTTLRFTTHTRGGGAAHVVVYRVEPDPARPGIGTLLRQETLSPAPPNPSNPTGFPVLENVRDFRVRCFDGTAWRADWTPGELPHAVEVGVSVDDGQDGVAELHIATTLPTAR